MNGIVIQIISTVIISMGNYFAGYSIAWSSTAIPTLESAHSPLDTRITKNEGYLIGSLPMLGCVFSVFYTGWLCDNVGRKRTLLLFGLVYVLSWSIITTASNVLTLIIGRFIAGMANGMYIVVCFPFLGELAQPSIRGTLASVTTCNFCMGTLMAYVTGWFCSYRVINYLNLTLCVGFVLLVCLLKETPVYLLEKGKDEEAMKSLQFYRGVSKPTQKVVTEFKYLRRLRESNNMTVDSNIENSNLDTETARLPLRPQGTNTEISAWKLLRKSKAGQRALVIATIHIVLQVFGGTLAVAAYAGQLFTKAVPNVSPHLCSVILAVAFAAGSFLAMILSDLMGRRTLMISSSITSSVCLALVSSLLRWSWAPQWAIPAAVLAYCCCFQIGVANVPLIQLSEIFIPKLKSLSTMIAVTALCTFNFVLLALFGLIVDTFGLDGTFLVFSIMCAFTSVVAYFLLRETKGVPLEVIQEMFEEGYLYRKRIK